MAFVMAFESQAIAPPPGLGCIDEVFCGKDDKQKTLQDVNDADTMDTLAPMDASDDDEGSEGPWRSEETDSEDWSEGQQFENDDSLLKPVKIVPEALQPDQGDLLEFVKVGSEGLPMYVALSEKSLPCTALMTKTRPSQNQEQLAETCICGRDFALDANFCQKCGERRPKVDASCAARQRRSLEAHDEQFSNINLQGSYENRGDGDVDGCLGDIFSQLTFAEPVNKMTTFMISGIPQTCPAKIFRDKVLSSFTGGIDFLYTPCDQDTGVHINLAVINLVDASHAQALLWSLKSTWPECEMAPAQVQGYEACKAVWGAAGEVASSNTLINQQFRKTKMCAFFMKGKCLRDGDCVYAHSRAELQQNPDLAKTRLCHNFLRRKCFDKDCKYAHGQEELRATESVYKTVLCRWWSETGVCKMGAACRFAHAPEELRSPAGPTLAF